MSYEAKYEEAFRPYCIDFFSKEDEEVFKRKIHFANDKKYEAFAIFQAMYDTNYGSINIDENLVSIHTGGWSENEAIIYEFKKTEWWRQYLRMSAVGGHYYFDTARHIWEKEWDITKTSASPCDGMEEGVKKVGIVPTDLRISEKAQQFLNEYTSDFPPGNATCFAAGAKWMKDLLIHK